MAAVRPHSANTLKAAKNKQGDDGREPKDIARYADLLTLCLLGRQDLLGAILELAILKVAIVGGGPSDPVTLKYLCEAQQSLGCEPVEAVMFEYQNDVGGTFLARAYEDAELVSSKQLPVYSTSVIIA
ncbi:hypothetical protein HC256_004314 [Beauveria bassiana]|nr:hypothetical protein HC256_004314 [Beauveria bassiana]